MITICTTINELGLTKHWTSTLNIERVHNYEFQVSQTIPLYLLILLTYCDLESLQIIDIYVQSYVNIYY